MAAAIPESSSAPRARAELAPEEHVAGGIDVVGQRELLVDDLDAVLAGLARDCGSPPVRPLITISPESAGCAPDSVCISVDLPGTVSADEADDLAGIEVDADVVDRVHAAEGHSDVAELDERCAARVGRGLRRRGLGHLVTLSITADHGRPDWMITAESTRPTTSAPTAH